MIGPLVAGLLAAAVAGADSVNLYRAMLLRAAPSALPEVIEVLRERDSYYRAAGEEVPFVMRHSQGDQWDLLVITPMGSFAEYYVPARVDRRRQAAKATGTTEVPFTGPLRALIAWREEVFVTGPPLDRVAAAFAAGDFYHIEMFRALPGKYDELRGEREMENAYLSALGRPQNLIFERVAGAAWDLFTIGSYRDIKHFAASADIPPDREDAAARAAGFESADRIGVYLRSLMDSHHDTLARAVRP